MLKLEDETLIALADVPPLLPRRRGGRCPHVSCIYRWAQRGLRGVKLEVLQIGGTKCTSREALQRFFERLSGQNSTTLSAPRERRKKQVAKANADLEQAGW